jgi:hypothetical protein
MASAFFCVPTLEFFGGSSVVKAVAGVYTSATRIYVN